MHQNTFLKTSSLFLSLFLTVWAHQSIAQTQTKRLKKDYKEYTANEGYKVFDVNSMVFDDLGWLWISGKNPNVKNSFMNNQPIIQRFDGQSFYTLELPAYDNAINLEIFIKKRPDGQMYIIYNSENNIKLFLVNPYDLVFKEIDLPAGINYNDIFLFFYKDYALVYLRFGINVDVYRLNHETLAFQKLPHQPVTKKDLNELPYFSSFIPFQEHFMINDSRNGIYSYLEDGSVDQKITNETLGLDAEELEEQLEITTWFKKDGKTYVLFNNSKDYFYYDSDLKTWTKSEVFKTSKNTDVYLNKIENIYKDDFGNLIRSQTNQDSQSPSIIIKGKQKHIEIPYSSKSLLASRKINKELFVEFNGILRHYSFLNKSIKTFLKDKSIRGLHNLNDEEVLVATENSGWYKINLATEDLVFFDLSLNGKPYLAHLNRGLFEAEAHFWSNDENGIIKVDKKTHQVTSYIYFPVADMTEDDKYIYYGTKNQNLLKFDKVNEQNKVIKSTENYDVQGILKINDAIYLATTTGLVVFDNQKLNDYKVDNIQDNSYFLSIAHHSQHGILLGSRSGNVYRFDPARREFSLVYEDDLKASIASLLFDDMGNIWINTFNGLVKFNPITKVEERFSMSDGLSYYEANRYSALKTKDGHFLVGTLNGLNYFHPQNMSKANIDVKLTLASVTYIDPETKKEYTETAPQKINDLKKIELPADSKSIFLKLGLLGIYNPDQISYRYKLNEQPWVNLLNTNELRLFSLASGDYNLQIEAIDSTKKRIGKPINLSLSVNTLFYQTAWFYILVSLLVLGIWSLFYFENKKKHRLRAKYASDIVQSQEAERVRIAKELHDSIGQRLLLLKNQFFTSKENPNTSLIDQTINEVRTISHNLHPFRFETLGLVKSLENMMDAFQKSSSVFYSYDIDDISGMLSKEKELFLFRILQECISNVEKHARASACNLKIVKQKNSIIFTLKDNGVGFSVENAKHHKTSLGMQNLKERAQYINAFFEINSTDGKGTKVTIKLNTNANKHRFSR